MNPRCPCAYKSYLERSILNTSSSCKYLHCLVHSLWPTPQMNVKFNRTGHLTWNIDRLFASDTIARSVKGWCHQVVIILCPSQTHISDRAMVLGMKNLLWYSVQLYLNLNSHFIRGASHAEHNIQCQCLQGENISAFVTPPKNKFVIQKRVLLDH